MERVDWSWSLSLCGLLLVTCGCLPRNPSVDLLHARLRQNEEQLTELQASLNTSQSQLKQAQREIDTLRTELAEGGHSRIPPEQAAALVQVTRIEVQPWLSGGINKDDEAGDDALAVQFVPRDDQGEMVKLPGNVKITLTDPAAESDQQHVGEWTFNPEECREQWTRGLMGGGYQFTLPWEDSPRNSRLVVHVEYETPDGRTFADTQLVRVNPSPEALARRKSSRPLDGDDLASDEDVRPAARLQTSRKPQWQDEPDDEPTLPHSVNWTEESIPRLR
jgi:hypothetical protein